MVKNIQKTKFSIHSYLHIDMSLPDSSDDVNHENHNQDPKHTEDNCESDQTFGGAITRFHVHLFVFPEERVQVKYTYDLLAIDQASQ